MLDVPKLLVVAKAVPPVAAAYQIVLPALEVAERVTLPVPHLLAGVVPVIVGVAFTVAITAVRAEVQLPFEAST
jgi:hypothetical protein